MAVSKAIYNRLPQIGQTLLLNAYGLKTRYRMRKWDGILASIAESERWSAKEQAEFVSGRLRNVLSHAIRTVPRYGGLRKLLDPLSNTQSDVFAILGEFPVVSKGEVLADSKAFLSSSEIKKRPVRTLTSGTTGTPFATWMDRATFDTGDALGWRRNLWAGYRQGDWIARLVGDPVIPLADRQPRVPFRISWTDRRLYLSTFHLNPQTARTYIEILGRKRPSFLMGYPSAIEILCAFALENDLKLSWQPKAVLYSSEPLYDHQREIIARVFKAPIRGFYGSAERVISASECEHGSYHLSLVDGYVEGQDRTLPIREPSLVTTLTNRVMPLIRFELGDHLQFRNGKPCACGRTLPMIDPVITKQEDWLETPAGRRISSSILTWAFKGLEGIRRSQVVQISGDKVEVHVAADAEAFNRLAPVLQSRLGEMFFGEMAVACVRDQDIPMTSAGKTRFVVSRTARNSARSASGVQGYSDVPGSTV